MTGAGRIRSEVASRVRGRGSERAVSTAADAHRLAIEQEPDLAVVDINLKGEMACGLIDQLRDLGVRVVVSGYAVLPGLTEKVAAVLQKPFNGPELLAALRRALSS